MGLFGSLKQILAPSKPTASPQSFHVRCLCGEPVQGLRREEHQVISCQVCGSSVFIFPRSALPPPEGKMQGTSLEDMPTTRSAPAPQRQPKRPVAPAARAGAKSPPVVSRATSTEAKEGTAPSKALRRPEKQVAASTTAEQPKGQLPPGEAGNNRPAEQAAQSSQAEQAPVSTFEFGDFSLPPELDRNYKPAKPASGGRRQPVVAELDDDESFPVGGMPATNWSERSKRLLKPTVFLPILFVVVGLAGYLTWRSRSIESIRTSIVPRIRVALDLLAKANFDQAREDLKAIVRDLDQSGIKPAEEFECRQGLAELLVLENLATQPFDSFPLPNVDPATITENYRGKSMIFETIVTPKGNQFQTGLIAWLGSQPMRINPAGIELFRTLDLKKPTLVIFSATVNRIEEGEKGDWWLSLEPNSGLLITTESIYEKLHLAEQQDAKAVRKQQVTWAKALSGLTESDEK